MFWAALDSLLGDRESAERLFTAALAQATGFGALIHRASTLTAWAAHLSADSNREIAARLKISENTAANHVRSILLKTETPVCRRTDVPP